jgi:hypothetical protein
MIPVIHPDTITNPMLIKWHHKAIKQSHENSFFVCNSEPTRDDLTAVYPDLRARSVTIPCMLSDAYAPDSNPNIVNSIIDSRWSTATGQRSHKSREQKQRYIMCVSALEPRKNFVGLIQAFNVLKSRPSIRRETGDLKLLIVGGRGWKCKPILAAMRELLHRDALIHLEKVTADELRVLYTHAEAFVFPSYSEGFGIPPLEAMSCDAPVIASDIPAHRWVLGDAALYCNPYDVTSIATAIERLVASDESAALRATLIARGRERIKLYRPDICCRQWVELLHGLKNAPARVPTTLTLPGPCSLERVA